MKGVDGSSQQRSRNYEKELNENFRIEKFNSWNKKIHLMGSITKQREQRKDAANLREII